MPPPAKRRRRTCEPPDEWSILVPPQRAWPKTNWPLWVRESPLLDCLSRNELGLFASAARAIRDDVAATRDRWKASGERMAAALQPPVRGPDPGPATQPGGSQ